MKVTILLIILLTINFITGCTEDNTTTPPVNYNPDYYPTTAILTLEDSASTTTQNVQYEDLDFQGGNPPTVDTLDLLQGKNYDAILTLLDKNRSPSQDVSQEIRNNPNFYQVFYTLIGNIQNRIILNVTDADDNSPALPLGLRTFMQVASVGPAAGSLQVTLTKYTTNKSLQPGSDTLFTAQFPVRIN